VKAKGFVLTTTLLLGVSRAIPAPQGETATPKKNLKKEPVTSGESESGAKLYKNYCAACHGVEGKGDGPVARFLKGPPADLSTLAQRNNGKYPADRVAATLRSGTNNGIHGTSDMPIWGPVFQSQGKGGSETRIHKLTEFVESLQQNEPIRVRNSLFGNATLGC
jgi:mono/diheme cytochrome c family protein